MKALTYSLCSLALLMASGMAQDKANDNDKKSNVIEAELVSFTISKQLPEDLAYDERPISHRAGASLVFFFKSENLVEIDKESFSAKGWSKHFRSHLSKSRKTGSITIYNRNFKGLVEELEVDGSVSVLVGTKSKSKEFILKKGDAPLSFPGFTIELSLREKGDANDFINQDGIKSIGNFSSIKSLSIIRGDKVITSNGYGSSGDTKTFSFPSIKNGDKVKIVYWTDLTSKTIKFYK